MLKIRSGRMTLNRQTAKPNRLGGALGIGLLAVVGTSPAWAEPPIRSPQDAACRAEAKAKVFSAPNPTGLDIEEVGRGLYYACMKRIAGTPAGSRARRYRRE